MCMEGGARARARVLHFGLADTIELKFIDSGWFTIAVATTYMYNNSMYCMWWE